MKKKQVLIVEDSRLFRNTLTSILCSRFSTVTITEAASVADAMKIIETDCPAFIIMDIRLPDGNGLELTATIKARNQAKKNCQERDEGGGQNRNPLFLIVMTNRAI